jgi:hypothetical protein
LLSKQRRGGLSAPASPDQTANDQRREEYWKKHDEEQRQQIKELNNRLKSAQETASAAVSPPTQFFSLLILPAIRGSQENEKIAIPPGTNLIDLQFSLDASKRFPSFSVKLTSGGHPILEQHGLQQRLSAQRSVVSVYAPKELMAAGTYDAVLYGVDGTQERPLYDYHFEVSQ